MLICSLSFNRQTRKLASGILQISAFIPVQQREKKKKKKDTVGASAHFGVPCLGDCSPRKKPEIEPSRTQGVPFCFGPSQITQTSAFGTPGS